MIKVVKEDNKLYTELEISKLPNDEKKTVYNIIKDINDLFYEYQENRYPIIEKVFKDYLEKIDNELNNVIDDVEKNLQPILFK